MINPGARTRHKLSTFIFKFIFTKPLVIIIHYTILHPYRSNPAAATGADNMKALTPAQQSLLDLLPVGQSAIVLTSGYATVYNNPDKRPILYSTAPALRGLVARGLITANHYWRGADVTRIA